MRFCPKCGGFLVPIKKDGKDYLKCNKCGYERAMKEEEKKEYTIKSSKSRSERVLTTSLVSDKSGRNPHEEELAQEREEYYKEIGLDLLKEEFESGEESEEE